MAFDAVEYMRGIHTYEEMAVAFADEATCRRLLEALVWPHGRRCPKPDCGSFRSFALADRAMGKTKRPGLYQCCQCGHQFTATSGTPLHATKLPIKKWMAGLWLTLQSDKGVSSVRLGEALGVSQKATWRVVHALRLLMADHEAKFDGIVEADDVRVGGKPRKDPSSPDARRGMQGHTTKKPVLSVVQRSEGESPGAARLTPLDGLGAAEVAAALAAAVEPSAHLMSDTHGSLGKAGEGYAAHDTVSHSDKEFVRGIVHANSAEALNDRVRRTVAGVFHFISPEHSQGYFDEISFRWSQRVYKGTANRTNRKGRVRAAKQWERIPPAQQMVTLLGRAVGRRLRRTKVGSIEVISRASVAYTPRTVQPSRTAFGA
ncbi:IS1595 family transposase [Azospirillum sp. sgz301742]